MGGGGRGAGTSEMKKLVEDSAGCIGKDEKVRD